MNLKDATLMFLVEAIVGPVLEETGRRKPASANG
jgi:hypothetical protein